MTQVAIQVPGAIKKKRFWTLFPMRRETQYIERVTAPLEMEQIRLESLVRVAYEDRHYHHACSCDMCLDTRAHLSARDLHFIDTISEVMSSPLLQPGDRVPLEC